MHASRLTNDTRTPPQARILAAVFLTVGLASVLGAFKPWQDEDVVQGVPFWAALAVVAFITWLIGSALKVAEHMGAGRRVAIRSLQRPTRAGLLLHHSDP